MKRFTWKIGGEAGYGILTSGTVFSKLATRAGYHIFDYIEYPSLIRGGHNAYEVVVSDEEVHAFKDDIDCLVCLDKPTFEYHKHRLTSESMIIYDPGEFQPEGEYIKVEVPFKQILQELQGQFIMKNTIALGATIGLLGGNLSEFEKMLETQFAKKGQQIVDFNKKFAQRGYEHVVQKYAGVKKSWLEPLNSSVKLVISGNDAFSLGCTIADCRLYCAYPMTPSSTVLTTLAAWQNKTGMVVRHAEDEIAVINTALGGSFAGVRAAVGTSGGGFALMVESISLAGVTETPIVIFLVQRPGPATGMPTWTEQGDLLFAVHAGHGEFPKIVLAPGDVEEMVELTSEAFNLADIYQTPVIVMSDMFLSESHKSIDKVKLDLFTKSYQADRGKTVTTPSAMPYLRYKAVEDGISERLIPGAPNVYFQANSYEHLEDGHTTEEAEPRIQQVKKRARKEQTYLKNHFKTPKIYGTVENSDIIFISWGSTKGPLLEAQRLLKEKGKHIAIIHFTHLYPLDVSKIKQVVPSEKRVVGIENNAHGQFSKLLRMETGIEIKEQLLKFDGRPFHASEIVNYVESKHD